MKRTLVAVAMVVFFVMALAVPAFAIGSMSHTKTAEIDGTIDWELQAGHLCNTGLEFKSTIQGSGVFSKEMSTVQVRGKTTVSDANDFVAGASNLSIISTIELCAPPKYEVTVTDYVYYDATINEDTGRPYGWYTREDSYIPTVNQGYRNYWGEYEMGLLEQAQMAHPESAALLATLTTPQLLAALGGAHPGGGFATYDWDPVSTQIWAVHVNADPGFSGSLHQDFEAAYGPFARPGGFIEDKEDVPTSGAGTQAFYLLGNRPYVGKDYVGNYFTIDQHARTSMGAVQRFIDISSPWSHAYVMEDMTVVGKSEIEESFSMMNVGKGADVASLWYDIF